MKESTAVAVSQPSDLIGIIDRVVGTGEMTADKVSVLERLLAMQMTVREEDRRSSFAVALAGLQAEIPQIQRAGVIKDRAGAVRSRYSLHEDIDDVVRPLLAKWGFSVSMDEEDSGNDRRKFSMKLLHRDGHSETKHKSLPFDHIDSRSRTQSEGSTRTYASRLLLRMHLNIVEAGVDNDGQDGEVITEQQSLDLQIMLADTKSDTARFLKLYKISKLSELPANEWKGVIATIEEKRRSQK